jgi:hypothetical protein
VAYADMTVEDVRPALDRLMRFPRLRGIRQQFHWHENTLYRFAAQPDLCRDRTVQRNVARLADYRLAFDLQVFAGQMDGACELADACPKVTLVLQHAGMLEDLSDTGRAAWREAMTDLARRPNVVAKLSGFGTFIHRLRPRPHRLAHDRDRGDLRRGPLPLGIELPHREALDGLRHALRGAPAGGRRAVAGRTAGDLSRHREPGLPAELRGGTGMGLEIKILDFGDIELESSFLVLGRDCGRVRRVPTTAS